MIQTCSITDENGLTISLEVSVPPSFFEPSCETSEANCADAYLVSSAFAQVLPQLSTQLLQVRSAIELALAGSCCDILKSKIDEQSCSENPKGETK